MKKLLAGLMILGFLSIGAQQAHASLASDLKAQIIALKNELVSLKSLQKASVLNTVSTGDTTPRIMFWPGKVNQHVDSDGAWQTDADGRSGGWPSTMYANDYGDRQLEYCKKFYPNSTSFEAYKNETISTWRDAGNASAYTSTKMSYKCVQGGSVIVAPNCIDSDGGEYPFVKGSVSLIRYSSQSIPNQSDVCYSSSTNTHGYSCTGTACQVMENYCVDHDGDGVVDNYNSSYEDCPYGCSNGACIKDAPATSCTDSDGGINLDVAGFTDGRVNGIGASFYDKSVTSNGSVCYGTDCTSVAEGYCKNNAVTNSLYQCPSGYSVNGACVAKTTTPSITITSPNGGETFTAGQQITLRWTSKNMPASPRMNIGLVNSSGVIVDEPSDQAVGNNQSWTYTIPKSVRAGKYKIQINFKDNSAEDYSDSYFTINENSGGGCLDSYPSLYANYYSSIPTEVLLGDKNIEIAKFILTASDSCKLTIKSIGFAGGGAITENVNLYNEAGTLLSRGVLKPNNSNGYIFKLNTPIVLNNNDSKKLIVKSDINKEIDGNTAIQSFLLLSDSEIIDNESGSLLTYEDIKDNSMNPFQKIIAKKNHTPFLNIIYPNGGEKLNASELIHVVFQTNNAYPAVHDISLINWNSSRGFEGSLTNLMGAESTHGISFTDNQIKSSQEQTISFSLQKAIQEWKWNINSNDKYSIKICVLPYRDSCKESGKFNFTTTPITTPSITVLSPNGGESYKIDDKIKIKWKSENLPSNAKVAIYLKERQDSEEGLAGYGLHDSMLINDGEEILSISSKFPKLVKYGQNYKINIVYYKDNTVINTIEDSSDNYFTVISSSDLCPQYAQPFCPNGTITTITDEYGCNKPICSTSSCLAGQIFNSVTGERCSSSVDNGCLPGYNFSATTGARCPTLVVDNVMPITRTLKLTYPRMTGDDVKILQGYLGIIPADGVYGRGTMFKVMEWQRANGLYPDGAFGYQSRVKSGLGN